MAKFDVAGAKAAGYSDDEIRQFIASLPETAKAKESGYSDAEIFDYFGVPTAGLTGERAAKVMVGAAAPTAAGLAAGGLMGLAAGAPVAPAAALGAGLLGGAELVGNVYNIARSAAGYKPVKTPFEYIRSATETAFPSVAPQTPMENVLRAATEGGLGALTGAGAARTGVNILTRGGQAAPSILNALAAQPAAQTVSGAVSAAVPEALAQGGEKDPFVLGAAGLLSGYGAGRAVSGALSPRRASIGEMAEAKRGRMEVRETTAWDRAYKTGGQFDNARFTDFVINAGARLRNEGFAPNDREFSAVQNALEQFSDAARGNVLDIQEAHRLRRRIGDISTSDNPNVRRLGGILADEYDSFLRNPVNARPGFEAQTARGVAYMDRAIETSSRLFRNDEIREAIRRASISKQSPIDALRNEFAKIFRDEDKLRKFSVEDREVIADLAGGRASPRAVQLLGALAPGTSWSGVARGVAQFGPALAAATTPVTAVVSPAVAAGLAGLGAGSILARRAQNALATRAAGGLLASTLGGVPTLPADYRNLSPLLASGIQNAMANR